jgi:tRNA threonylcarbamoyl adenosine modification protein YjeE
MSVEWTRELDQAGVVRLAELIALKLRAGDVVALRGELGAGKTTLARALVAAVLGDDDAEVPSPTFSLVQVYASRRLTVAHYDFYRLSSADDVRELGFEDALLTGAAVVEWPERAETLLPESRYEVELADTGDAGTRRVTVRGLGDAAPSARRIGEVLGFLDAQTAWRGARIRHLQGDASTRSYARLRAGDRMVVLMDAPRQPDGPPIHGGRSYSRIAHLAEDMVRPFVAIGAVLRSAGLSAPEVLSMDLERGLLLIEDLGDGAFGAEVAAGCLRQAELWRTAVDALIALRGVPLPRRFPLPDGSSYALPRRDRDAFEIEIELLLDWYWPAVKGAQAPEPVRAEFKALWAPVIGRLLALPGGWFLRDYHSPNLIWLPERAGIARVGIIDFQDALEEHFAFDLVSLLQDARITVAEELERELFAHYCAEIAGREPGFDRAAFAAAYADFGAQRNTRLLGLWARLLERDGKPQYVQHIPRTWGYLARNLGAPALAPLAAWYDRHFPPDLRARTDLG